MINTWLCLTYFLLSVITSLHLILGFFGFRWSENIHGNSLGGIMQQANY